MTLQSAVIEMMRRPGLLAVAPPGRILAFNPGGMLRQFDRGKDDYARLKTDDFLREDFDVMTPEQMAELASKMPGGES